MKRIVDMPPHNRRMFHINIRGRLVGMIFYQHDLDLCGKSYAYRKEQPHFVVPVAHNITYQNH
jgi:hypothetical protein